MILLIILLCIYAIYCSSVNHFYMEWPITLLNHFILLNYWILFNPFMETFMGIFKCENGMHKIAITMNCYSGVHIFYVVFTVILIIILFTITILSSIFAIETHPISHFAFSKMQDSTEVIILFYRMGIVIYSTFVYNVISLYCRKLGIGFLFLFISWLPY